MRYDRMLTQAELAAAVGISQAHLSRIEKGEQRGGWRTRRRIAHALGAPLTAVFPDEEAN